MTYLAENSEILIPPNYLAYWLESDYEWVSYEELVLEHGGLDWATHEEIYLFQNMTLMENEKQYPGNSDLISVSVDFNLRSGWIEITGFTYIKSWWPGCEIYEPGIYIGEVEYSSRLKELLVGKFYELMYDEEESGSGFSEPDLLYEDDEELAYRKPNYGFDDYEERYGDLTEEERKFIRRRVDEDERRFDYFAEGGSQHE